MAKAWVYQDDKQVKKHGTEAASWYVGWFDPEGNKHGKSCGPGEEGQRNAEKLRKKREAELITGTYQQDSKTTWKEFREEYDRRVLAGLAVRTRDQSLTALAHFERLVKPKLVGKIKTAHVSDYVAARRKEPGKKKGETCSPATINKELRHVKAALNMAVEWEHLEKAPRFHMEKVPKKLVRFMTAEHFAAIYGACDTARLPNDQNYPAADWWRGLMTFAYLTGWRISDMLALRRDDLDMVGGYAVTLYEDNKGGRDDKVKLHPVIIEHLKKLAGFSPFVFPWTPNRRTLDEAWDRIQREAGINLSCSRRHLHTDACHLYGFHDLRRAFATMNADRLTPDALQTLMRHKSYLTTQVYINLTRQVDDAVNVLHVPDVLKNKGETA